MSVETNVGDTGNSGDTGNNEDTTNIDAAQSELDEWASQDESPSRPREKDGRFVKRGGKFKESEDAMRDVVKDIRNNERAVRGNREEEEDEQGRDEEQEGEEQEEKPRKTSRKVRALVNGKEEVIDLDDEEYQKINSVQAMRASQKAFREAAQMRKETQQLKAQLEAARQNVRQDPMKLFKVLGIDEQDVMNFAQNLTINKLSETIDPTTGQPYTPEQQRIMQLEKQLKSKEQLEAEAKQQQEQAELEKVKDVIRQDIDRKFTTALEETGLPSTPYTMMRLASIMEDLGPDVDPMTVAPLVVEDIVKEVSSVANGFPIEVVAEILGEKFLNKLRKYDIERARRGREKFNRSPRSLPNNTERRTPARGAKTSNPSDAQDWLDQWASR